MIIAAVVYFLIVSPMDRVMARADAQAGGLDPASARECLSEIPIGATRCMYCTSEVPRSPPPDGTAGRAERGVELVVPEC